MSLDTKTKTGGNTKANITAILDKYNLRTITNKNNSKSPQNAPANPLKKTKVLDNKTNYEINAPVKVFINKQNSSNQENQNVQQPVVKPVVMQPAVKPVVMQPAVKPVVTQPAVKPVVMQPAVKPVVMQPAVKPVVTQPAVKPVVMQPVVKPVVMQQPKISVQSILENDKINKENQKRQMPVAVINKNHKSVPNMFDFIPTVKSTPLTETVNKNLYSQQATINNTSQPKQPQIKTLQLNPKQQEQTIRESEAQPKSNARREKHKFNPLDFIPQKSDMSAIPPINIPSKNNNQNVTKTIHIDPSLNEEQSQNFIGEGNKITNTRALPTVAQQILSKKTPTNMPVRKVTTPVNITLNKASESDSIKILEEKRALLLKQQKEEFEKLKFKKEQINKLNNRKKEIALMRSIELEKEKLRKIQQKQSEINNLINNTTNTNVPSNMKVVTTQPNVNKLDKEYNIDAKKTLKKQRLQQTYVIPQTHKVSTYDKINMLNSTNVFHKKEVKEDKKEIKVIKEDKKEVKEDKKEVKEVKEDKKEVKEDRKEVKEVKEDRKEVKEDRKEVKDVKEDKKEVKEDKKEVKKVKEDRKEVKEVKEDKKEVKEVKEDRKEVEEVKEDKKEVKEVKEDKKEVKEVTEVKSNMTTQKKLKKKTSNNLDEYEYYSKKDKPDVQWGNRNELYDFNNFINKTTFVNNVCTLFCNEKYLKEYSKSKITTEDKNKLLKTTYGFKHLDKLQAKLQPTKHTDTSTNTHTKTNTNTSKLADSKDSDKPHLDIIDYMYRTLFFDNIKLEI
jgi:hypothetical protein